MVGLLEEASEMSQQSTEHNHTILHELVERVFCLKQKMALAIRLIADETTRLREPHSSLTERSHFVETLVESGKPMKDGAAHSPILKLHIDMRGLRAASTKTTSEYVQMEIAPGSNVFMATHSI